MMCAREHVCKYVCVLVYSCGVRGEEGEKKPNSTDQTIYNLSSLVPRLPQLISDACRKTKEPDKIYHVRDVRWKGLATVCTLVFLRVSLENWKEPERVTRLSTFTR